MLLYDYGVRDGQALARAFTHLLRGEEGGENLGSDVFGDASAGVAYPYFRPPAIPMSADADGTLLVRVAHHVANRVGCVHNQIEDHLVELAGQAGNGRQFAIQIGRQIGDVLPFVFGDQDGAFDGSIDIHRRLLHLSRMREFFHGSNDPRDLGHAFEQLFDGFGNLVAQVVDVHVVDRPFQGSYKIGLVRVAKGTGYLGVGIDEGNQVAEGIVQKLGVVADVLDGGVDFVSDPRRKLSDGLQLLRDRKRVV